MLRAVACSEIYDLESFYMAAEEVDLPGSADHDEFYSIEEMEGTRNAGLMAWSKTGEQHAT
jgi:hypothetical protein